MGSPLGPVLAGIFMVDLETKVIPTVKKHMYGGLEVSSLKGVYFEVYTPNMRFTSFANSIWLAKPNSVIF